MSNFDGALASIAQVHGWLSRDQAERLWSRAGDLGPQATIVEIGSFQGRSTIVLALGSPATTNLVAIDPHAGNDRGPQEISGFAAEAASDHETFLANLAAAGVTEKVTHLRAWSAEVADTFTQAIDLLYVDGAHRFAPARDDIRSWGAKVKPGGVLLIHDAYSSIGVTAAIASTLWWSRQWSYEGRSRSLAQYRRGNFSLFQTAGSALRQKWQLGYFLRNLVYKVLLSAHLATAARWLGSNGEWPY
jgi:predicted O-methyltransferase YrrM